MPLPEEQKNSTPFKSVDIKTLFLAASSRKRKATSPIPTSTEAKTVKICDKETDEDIQISDPSEELVISDTKENKDLNTPSEQVPAVNNDIQIDENVQKDDSSQISCDEDSFKDSSDEQNSSQLNSSVNALNTSGISEANLDIASVENNDVVKEESVTVNITGKENKSNPKKRKRMTPEEAKKRSEERENKQQERLRKKQEQEAKKKQREQELQEKKLQKEMEKKAKEEEKKAKEEEKKEKERQRLEKKEQEEKEKQMKIEERENQKRIRQMQLEAKLEMKKQKEEMKLKQEEERKKAEEEKKKAELEKEQKEKEKKERAKAAFVKFFVKENVSPPPAAQKVVEKEGSFKPFQISEDMTLAPVVPTVAQERFNRERLDTALLSQKEEKLYIEILKSGSYRDVRQRKRQRKPKLCDAEVIIMDKSDQASLLLRAKMLQFSENVRPPYWGTWRKKSKKVRPRNPWGEDEIFDYSVDSDDEWDEGGPGESLSGTEPEDESEDDYEVDNEFFVPHGYLSAEEEKEEDEEGKENEVVNDPEKQKALLKKKQQEFDMERKKKTTELKPIILGCYIENCNNSQNELRALLEPYSAVFLTDSPIQTSFTVKKNQSESRPNSTASSPTSNSNSSSKVKAGFVPEEAMPYLIRLIHGNTRGLQFLILEFQKFWQQHCAANDQTGKSSENMEVTVGNSSNEVAESPATAEFIISKRQLAQTVKKIAVKQSVEAAEKPAWWVNKDTLEKYNLTNVSLPNTWTYTSTNNKEEIDSSPIVKSSNASIKEFLVL